MLFQTFGRHSARMQKICSQKRDFASTKKQQEQILGAQNT